MTLEEFSNLFDKCVEELLAREQVDLEATGAKVVFKLVAFGLDGLEIGRDAVCSKLYLGGCQFYRIIDLLVLESTADCIRIFVRPSGHPPAEWKNTIHADSWLGPFKLLERAA